jgi:hypothetical protein
LKWDVLLASLHFFKKGFLKLIRQTWPVILFVCSILFSSVQGGADDFHRGTSCELVIRLLAKHWKGYEMGLDHSAVIKFLEWAEIFLERQARNQTEWGDSFLPAAPALFAASYLQDASKNVRVRTALRETLEFFQSKRRREIGSFKGVALEIPSDYIDQFISDLNSFCRESGCLRQADSRQCARHGRET